MPVLKLTKEQIFDLVRQMPADQKREILALLAGAGAAARSNRQAYAQEQLRRLCSTRGLDWDAMSPDQREAFIDDLVHEDRPCGP